MYTPQAVLEDELKLKNTVAVTSLNVYPWFMRWSTYSHLLHVVAYCIRFSVNVRSEIRT